MEESRKIIVGAVVAVLLQLIASPNIVLFGVMPNFILTFVIMVSLMKPHEQHYVLAFVMGLLSDLMAYGLVGGMSFVLLLGSFLISRVAETVGGGNMGSAFLFSTVFSILIVFGYSFVLSAFGLLEMPAGLFYYALPSSIIDAVVACIWYAVGTKFYSASRMSSASAITPNLRFH